MNRYTDRVLNTLSRHLPKTTAALDWVQPRTHLPWGGPMNGQAHRRRMVIELIRELQPQGVIETGTFRGNTTAFLSDVSGVPVHSVEASVRYHTFARWRLGAHELITLHLGDSRTFLRKLATDSSIPKTRVLFYLDAHWAQDLPLPEELEIIAEFWQDSVVLIDDFEVPGDAGYRFDDYGHNAKLTEEVIPPSLAAWRRLYPAVRSVDETGHKRGCVVLLHPNVNMSVDLLREADAASS